MEKRFTIAVKKIDQSKLISFKDITLYHIECGSYRIRKAEISKDVWEFLCPRCKMKVIVHNDSKGTLPIMQTAVDGIERTYNQNLAVERVIRTK
ncbi:MAG: hypothetical protein A2V66_11820 [Ignavibacteria bacterium RBG_13_36_8]|nr:MAG: hypothetical protein A2V66_11820 [Ignavibacteria bacterium RBG_13_36_8]